MGLLVPDLHGAGNARRILEGLIPHATILVEPGKGCQVFHAIYLLVLKDVIGHGDGLTVLVHLLIDVEAIGPFAGIRVDDPGVEQRPVVSAHISHAVGDLVDGGGLDGLRGLDGHIRQAVVPAFLRVHG